MGQSLTKKIGKRPKEAHKGTYGHVFVLAGSLGMTGAAYLTSMAALRSGSGLVTLGIPKSINGIMEEKLTEAMTKPLAETNRAPGTQRVPASPVCRSWRRHPVQRHCAATGGPRYRRASDLGQWRNTARRPGSHGCRHRTEHGPRRWSRFGNG